MRLLSALSAAALLTTTGAAPWRAPSATTGTSAVAVHRPAPLDSLRAAIEARLTALRAEVPTAVVAVSVRDLAPGGGGFDLAGDSVFHAASTMKLPVMIELFRSADRGEFALDQEILLVNQFASVADGSPYALDAVDDSDSAAYAMVGRRVAVRELVRRMIVRSSNLATNAVIALADPARTTATARTLGAARIQVRRGVEDGPAFRAGIVNTTTAPDLAALLSALERGTAASPASTRAMLDILAAQEHNEEIPAGLPPGTRVAHKTGWITGVLHDAAIVYPAGRPPYVLVVLTRGIPDVAVARRVIVDVARSAHTALAAPASAPR
ncbi:MAG: serine hydrolase [Gemmatirosa sp.]